MDTVKIDARDVNFWYGDFHALKGISMQIEENMALAARRGLSRTLKKGISSKEREFYRERLAALKFH